jgi:hypothetical protein
VAERIIVTATGVWRCAAHVLDSCELHGQLWAGGDFPLEIVDLDRVWIEGPCHTDWPFVWRYDRGGIDLDITFVRPVRH